jgi:hypothetical protein
MKMSEKQIAELIQSIDALSKQIFNLDLRFQAFLENFGPLIKAISSSSQKKE